MVELKDDNIISMDEYLEDALADAHYALDELVDLMDYTNIYNIINKDNDVITYEDISKAQETLNLLSFYGHLRLIKIKV